MICAALALAAAARKALGGRRRPAPDLAAPPPLRLEALPVDALLDVCRHLDSRSVAALSATAAAFRPLAAEATARVLAAQDAARRVVRLARRAEPRRAGLSGHVPFWREFMDAGLVGRGDEWEADGQEYARLGPDVQMQIAYETSEAAIPVDGHLKMRVSLRRDSLIFRFEHGTWYLFYGTRFSRSIQERPPPPQEVLDLAARPRGDHEWIRARAAVLEYESRDRLLMGLTRLMDAVCEQELAHPLPV